MRGLVYLEWRHAVHQIAAIVRSPQRLLLWAPYAITIGYFVSVRLFAPGRTSHAFGLAGSYTEAIAALYAGALGVTIAVAAGGRLYAFRNAAEPVLFSNAGIRPRDIAIWLQLRKLWTSGARWITGVTYVFLIFAPRHASAFANARLLGIALLAVGVQMSADLPTFLLARGRLRLPLMAFGWVLAAAGFAFGATAIFAPDVMRRIVAFAHVDPGAAFATLLHGNGLAVVALVALLGALVGVVALLGDDALPELCAASQKTLATIRRADRRSPAEKRFATTASSPAARIPRGALAIVWKDWVGFRRGRGSLQFFVGGIVFSAGCGIGAALLTRMWQDPSPMYSLAAIVAIGLLVLAPFGASTLLASDLAKPLFWLSRAPLRTRIAAWTFARTWRAAVAIGCAPLVAGIVVGNVAVAIGALPLAFAIYWSLQSLGVGLFALFPNPIDSRGPMMFVRTLATGAYAVPPAIVAIVVLAFNGLPIVAVFASAIVFAIEGWIVVELASLRFAEHGASLAI